MSKEAERKVHERFKGFLNACLADDFSPYIRINEPEMQSTGYAFNVTAFINGTPSDGDRVTADYNGRSVVFCYRGQCYV